MAPSSYVAPAQYVAPSNAPAQYVAPSEPAAQYVAPATWTPCVGANCNQNIYVAGAKTAAAGIFSAVVVFFL
ncbi:hypothetical protein BC830DRAFT_1156540 [Chytriomyces sp. MP71]|nr:hypothetical protein BC830DRAFT_1156540 [Chytriomyces sp. MP71]